MHIKSFPKQQYNYPFRTKFTSAAQQLWKLLIKTITSLPKKESPATSDKKAEFNNLVLFT